MEIGENPPPVSDKLPFNIVEIGENAATGHIFQMPTHPPSLKKEEEKADYSSDAVEILHCGECNVTFWTVMKS